MTMFRKTTMAALVAAIAILGVVAVLQTGGGADEVSAVDASFADDIQDAFENGGNYTLTSNVDITGGTVSEDLVLDLNGHTLTTTDTITVNSSLTIRDSVGEGRIYSAASSDLIRVSSTGTLRVDSGTIELSNATEAEHTILSFGTLDFNGGTINRVSAPEAASSYAIRIQGGDATIDNAVVSSSDSGVAVRLTADGNDNNEHTHVSVNGSTISASQYGFAVFGIGDESDLDSVTLTLNDVTVNAGVGIGTNASSGANAGFTITVNSGIITGDHAIFAPSEGLYNINGGHLIGKVAGIQIEAGVLNINGDAVVETMGVNDGYDSLAPGGSGTGNICGAIIVGKHNGGYVGDIDVNINGGTLIAPEGGDAIVILDNSTGIESLSSYHINVDATGGEIIGDVMFTTATGNSNQNKDAGMIDFNLDGSSVDGDIIKSDDFRGDAVITSGTVTGDVTEDVEVPSSTGSVYFYDLGITTTYYDSFVLPSEPSRSIEGYTFLGYSLSPDSTTIDYLPGATVSGLIGNVTVYEVWENDNPFVPFPDDDDDYVPIPPVVYEDSGDDDTVTIVACAAAAVVAAILAVFLIVERKH